MKTLFLVLFLTVSVAATGQERNRGGRGGSQDESRHSSVPVSNSERPAGRTATEVSTSKPIDPPVYQAVVHVPVSPSIIQIGVDQAATHPAKNHQVILKDAVDFPGSAGFDFSEETVLSSDNSDADVVLEKTADGFMLFVPENGDIRDLGRTNSINDISEAPRTGWTETKSALLSVENSYVVRTRDNKYYKLRIAAVWQDSILFDWAELTVPRLWQTRGQSVTNKFPQ